MKKSILILITILFTTLIYGQNILIDSNTSDTFKYSGLNPIDVNPLVLVVVDSKSIELENFNTNDIKPKWIESVVVHKGAISKQVYGSKNGVIIIYTKKKYRRRVLKEIRKKDDA